MSAFLRKLGLAAVLLTFTLLAGAASWHFYRVLSRPTLENAGGTVLVYEVDTDKFPHGKPPPGYSPEVLAEALRQRLDPTRLDNIIVQPIDDTRVEISIPRQDDHTERVRRSKALASQAGVLEFRILANGVDDRDALLAARHYFEGAVADELKKRAQQGLPPPPPPVQVGGRVVWLMGYSWVELALSGCRNLDLDSAAENDTTRNNFWLRAAEARRIARAVTGPGECLFFSRDFQNRGLSADERRQKRYDYFVLCRDPAPEEAVGGQHLLHAEAVENEDRRWVVAFTLNDYGGKLFHELTSRNLPSGPVSEPFGRRLAIILDGQVVAAPMLRSAIRTHGMIAGNFSREQVEDIVQILRAGALPAALKPTPLSETSVDPRK